MLIMKERLEEIGKLVISQDNRITDAPMFIVEQKIRDYGYDSDYADDYVWLDVENEYEEATAEEAAECGGLSDVDGWQKVHYKDRWEFVTACFTEQGCKDFLKINSHNLKETRIYAEGSFRNNEFRDIRAALILYAQPDKTIP